MNNSLSRFPLLSELLKESETKVPSNVVLTLHFFEKKRISCKGTRNENATTCRDAAGKRWRNGKKGIPVSDELKTLLVQYALGGPRNNLAVINIPGTHQVNMNLAKKLLNATNRIIPATKTVMDQFGIGFGEVNPFHLLEKYQQDPVLQSQFGRLDFLFEQSLLTRKDTMMTNAGEGTWGIEFLIADIFPCLPSAQAFSFLAKE